MKAKSLFWLLITFLLINAQTAKAQQSKKSWRIGYLSGTEPAADVPRAEAIRLALRSLGYVEGENLTIEFRYAEGNRDRFPELAAELVRLKVDVILAIGGDLVIRPVMNATKTIPIVMSGGVDAVKAGLIESLARPGGNVTGLTSLASELGGKRLELLKEVVPKLARVAVLYDPGAPDVVRGVKEELTVSAQSLKLMLQLREIRAAGDFERVFAALSKQRPDGFYAPIGGPLIRSNYKRIAAFALKSRLPSVYSSSVAVDLGGLMSYGADDAESYRQVAWYVDRILKGAKPEDLPVQQPMKFELVINLKSAKQIGLTIPQWTLMKADRVIK